MVATTAVSQFAREKGISRFDQNKLPPIAKWQEELAVKTTEKDSQYREYYTLKDETAKVEKIKRSVAEILNSDTPGRKSIWVQTQDVEI